MIFTEVLMRNRKLIYMLGTGLAALILHLAAIVLLVNTAGLGIMGVIIAEIVFYGAVTVAGFFWLVIFSV